MDFVIEADGLSKRFGSTWALRQCSMRIPCGRVVALVGPNGAGKTTLLRIAMGLDSPTAGTISVLGFSPRSQAPAMLPRVGFVAQNRPIYKQFLVRDLFELGRRLNHQWDGSIAHERVRRYGIPLDRRTGELSGGQQAQVALALVLAKHPQLLLLDEPVGDLDPLARREFLQNLMDGVTADGVSVLLSSHIVSELERTCNHLIILSQGQVQLAGDIERLLSEHRLMVGPRTEASFESDPAVIECRRSDRQTMVVARAGASRWGPDWEARDVSLEDLVLAYLARPLAQARSSHRRPPDPGEPT